MWVIKCYESPNGKNDVQEHFDGASPSIQAGLITALEYLIERPRQDWDHPRTKSARLSNQRWPNYYEIRFFADRVQQRPIGYFGPDGDSFTILLWAIEKSHLQPKTWFATAERKREQLEEGYAKAVEFVPGED